MSDHAIPVLHLKPHAPIEITAVKSLTARAEATYKPPNPIHQPHNILSEIPSMKDGRSMVSFDIVVLMVSTRWSH